MTRLDAVRAAVRSEGLDGFIVPRADEHLGEYVPPAAERLAWLTGFTGSAGLAIVLATRAAVFTDGRYTLQLEQETDVALWERCHITETPPPVWLKANAPAGARIGYDARLISEEALARFAESGVALVASANPIDAVWTDRPRPPATPALPHSLVYAGQGSAEKRALLAAELTRAGQDAAVLSDPHAIAWLLNIRGADLDYTPVALADALLHADGRVDLFIDAAKLPEVTRTWLGNGVAVAGPERLAAALDALAGRRVRVDPAGTPAWFAQRLRAAGAEVVAGPDPTLLPKACKNAAEQEGARAAHGRDAIAVCRFLAWLKAGAAGATELSAADRLLGFRRELPGFRGESFPAIAGAGGHGAIIHYRAGAASNRALRPGEVFLIDSGAQYEDGTTDVTRTVWIGPGTPGAALRERYTRVLKGHIALAALVFPEGIAGPHIDGFDRAALWRAGLDYDHGTGHGVGSFLSVHEGPAGISRAARMVPLAPGMILSNEPGFYLPGQYGIRLENLLLVRRADLPEASRPFLGFETLTLAPFDRRLIVVALLDATERTWLDTYHARVLAAVGPQLDDAARTWLADSCAPLG